MKTSTITIALTSIIVILAAIATSIGLFLKDEGSSFEFITIRGQKVRILGQGLYKYDTTFFGAGFKGQDSVVLFLGIPLLVISLILSIRGNVIGQLLLTGMYGYFLYIYASMALGASYNFFFLLYIAIFSASLFAFIRSFTAIDLNLIAARIPGHLPVRGIAIFMFAAGLVTLFVWGSPLITALIRGQAPEKMDSYTTMVTFALDLAIITPASFLCAVLVLKGEPLGFAISIPLLTIIILLSPQIILSTVFQRAAGVPLSTGEIIGPISGFIVLGSFAAWLLCALFKGIK